jgi:predicted dinucleotide-binding enzyme
MKAAVSCAEVVLAAPAFNTLQARVLARQNHRRPRWVLFLSGDETAKPAVARLIQDAGPAPVGPGHTAVWRLLTSGGTSADDKPTGPDGHLGGG